MSPGFLCWMLVYLHPSRAFLVPTASSCNRAVPNPLLAARGSFSHRRFLLIDQLFFCFHTFHPYRAVDSFPPQPFNFPRWITFSKRFPKRPWLHSGRAAGSWVRVWKHDLQQARVWEFSGRYFSQMQVGLFLITLSTYQAAVESILLQFLRSCLSL